VKNRTDPAMTNVSSDYIVVVMDLPVNYRVENLLEFRVLKLSFFGAPVHQWRWEVFAQGASAGLGVRNPPRVTAGTSL
jgi:hypothetical protein